MFDLIGILPILVIVLTVTAFFVPKKKDYVYNSLDIVGIILNVILSFLYMVLSIMGVFTIFFSDAPQTEYSAIEVGLINTVIMMGLSIPLLSVFSIFTSVIARKRGKRKFSFIIQFLPVLVFAVMLILIFFMDKA